MNITWTNLCTRKDLQIIDGNYRKKALFHLIIFKLTLMFALFVKVEVHRNLCLLWQSKHCSYR